MEPHPFGANSLLRPPQATVINGANDNIAHLFFCHSLSKSFKCFLWIWSWFMWGLDSGCVLALSVTPLRTRTIWFLSKEWASSIKRCASTDNLNAKGDGASVPVINSGAPVSKRAQTWPQRCPACYASVWPTSIHKQKTCVNAMNMFRGENHDNGRFIWCASAKHFGD